MSHVFPEPGPVELVEYIRETINRIEDDFTTKLMTRTDEAEDVLRRCVVAQAYEVWRLVQYFNIVLHPDFSSKLADLMTNRLFY